MKKNSTLLNCNSNKRQENRAMCIVRLVFGAMHLSCLIWCSIPHVYATQLHADATCKHIKMHVRRMNNTKNRAAMCCCCVIPANTCEQHYSPTRHIFACGLTVTTMCATCTCCKNSFHFERVFGISILNVCFNQI